MFEIELTEKCKSSKELKESEFSNDFKNSRSNSPLEPLEPLYVFHKQKPFIICLFRDIPNEAETLLREYGKVIIFGPPFANRPLHLFLFDYFLLDFRKEEDRFYFKRFISNNSDSYFFILYRYYFETDHGMTFHNELVDFPSRQISKEEYDLMLLESPLPAPHCFLSLCRYLCK
jgi:hypothetical protein